MYGPILTLQFMKWSSIFFGCAKATNSTTWSNHIQLLSQKYGLPSPLLLMESEQLWPKESWKCLVKTKVTVYYEQKLRTSSVTNSKMNYFNVQLTGLSGRPHPALASVKSTQDVKKLRHHVKFLAGDFLTAEQESLNQPHLNPACKLCQAPVESVEHVLVSCQATAEVRRRIYPELMNVVSKVQPNSHILNNPSAPDLTQFILDCSSINLKENTRVPAHNPGICQIYTLSRDWCTAVSNERRRQLVILKQRLRAKTTEEK